MAYDYLTNFKITKQRLQQAFENLKSKQIIGCINKAISCEEKVWNEIKKN